LDNPKQSPRVPRALLGNKHFLRSTITTYINLVIKDAYIIHGLDGLKLWFKPCDRKKAKYIFFSQVSVKFEISLSLKFLINLVFYL